MLVAFLPKWKILDHTVKRLVNTFNFYCFIKANSCIYFVTGKAILEEECHCLEGIHRELLDLGSMWVCKNCHGLEEKGVWWVLWVTSDLAAHCVSNAEWGIPEKLRLKTHIKLSIKQFSLSVPEYKFQYQCHGCSFLAGCRLQ